MKLLRLKLFQETACYQKPFAFKVGETYPLAPFSTVKGLLHAILDAKEYIPMNISIQGSSESILIDYATKYMYKKITADMPLNLDGLGISIEPKDVTSMPMYVHLLYNVQHIIHVEAEEAILNELYERFSAPNQTLSLGRWEDLVRVDEVCFVEVEKREEKLEIPHNIYISRDIAEQFRAFRSNQVVKTYYRLPRKYEIINNKRNWDYVNVFFVLANQSLKNSISFDGQYPVFLMKG